MSGAEDPVCDWCGYDEDIEGPLSPRTAGDGSIWRLCPRDAARWDAEAKADG